MEALVTLTLVSLVLFSVFEMLSQSMRISAASHARDEFSASIHNSLDRLTAELREAVSIDGATSDTEITFHKVDTNSATRLEEVVPPPLVNQVWDPLNTNWTLKVRYYTAGGRLIRAIGPSAGPATHTSAISSNIQGMEVHQDAPGIFLIGVSVDFNGTLQVIKSVVVCPCVE
jgi:type II secretory pathway component PulJ